VFLFHLFSIALFEGIVDTLRGVTISPDSSAEPLKIKKEIHLEETLCSSRARVFIRAFSHRNSKK
jgi:hypothetical protein